MSAPSLRARSTKLATFSSCAFVAMGPICVSPSIGSPMRTAAARATSRSASSS
jgi:hypothetical protein